MSTTANQATTGVGAAFGGNEGDEGDEGDGMAWHGMAHEAADVAGHEPNKLNGLVSLS